MPDMDVAKDLLKYMDDKFIVVGDTLLVTDKKQHMTVPSEMPKGNVIRRVGKAAGGGNAYVSVKIPKNIKEIGEVAFSCETLRDVTIENTGLKAERAAFGNRCVKRITVSLKKEEYDRILLNSYCIGNNRYLVGGSFLSQDFLTLLTVGFVFNPGDIKEDFDCLFMTDSNECKTVPKLYDDRMCFDLIKGKKCQKSEDEGVLELIERNRVVSLKGKWDNNVDMRVKAGGAETPGCVILFEYSLPKDISYENGIYITLEVIDSVFFGQKIRRVKYDGKQYYIYQRIYIPGLNTMHATANTSPDFWRENIAVYDEQGLVTNYNLSEAVYEKYLFSALL